MDVTSENFESVLPIVEKLLESASFISFDFEFTGIHEKDNRLTCYDNPELFYLKNRQGVLDYLAPQFGLCIFTYDCDKDKYEYESFNFYIFPRPVKAPVKDWERKSSQYFSCQTSSLDFLGNQGFDFNKWIKQGISYMSENIYEEFKREIQFRTKRKIEYARKSEENAKNVKNAPIIPEDQKVALNRAVSSLEDLSLSNDSHCVVKDLTPFQRRLVYDFVDFRFGYKMIVETVDSENTGRMRDLLVKKCCDLKDYEEYCNTEYETHMKELENARGLCKLINLIRQKRVLLVGHNLFKDLLHLIKIYDGTLPKSYEQFKKLVFHHHCPFLDTKVLAGDDVFKELIADSNLERIQSLFVGDNPKIKIIPCEAVNVSCNYSDNKSSHHEAGYDAFLTGRTFINLIKFYEVKVSNNQPISAPINEFDRGSLTKFLNKVSCAMLLDKTTIDLSIKDEPLDRKHIFHIQLSNELFTNSDIFSAFSAYGGVHVHWISSTSAFVSLHKSIEGERYVQF